MPGQTPIYGFSYPCQDEAVSPLDFQILANQVDAKLLELQADYTFMLNRNNFDNPASPSQTIPLGVDTVLTAPLAQYVIPVSGVWIVYAHAFVSSATGTPTVHRVRVRQNGIVRFGQTQNTNGGNTNPCDAAGPINAVAGDVITLSWFFNGSGTEDVQAELAAKLQVRTA